MDYQREAYSEADRVSVMRADAAVASTVFPFRYRLERQDEHLSPSPLSDRLTGRAAALAERLLTD